MRRLIGRLSGDDEGEIDRILSRDDGILPSSGFAASVMDAVRREVAALPELWARRVRGVAEERDAVRVPARHGHVPVRRKGELREVVDLIEHALGYGR